MTVLISAHRGGARENGATENTVGALEAACRTSVDFIEFDVQRCVDGTLVLAHDDTVQELGCRRRIDDMTFGDFERATGAALTYGAALAVIRDAGKKAHIDLKFAGSDMVGGERPEVSAAMTAVELLGAGNCIVTTLEDSSVKAIRAWSAVSHPELLVGLSLGQSVRGLNLWEMAKLKLSELFPGRRYRACNANLVVVDYRLARLTVARWARRNRLPMLIWTVDGAKEVRRWLRRRDVWILTTNYPARALAERSQFGSQAVE